MLFNTTVTGSTVAVHRTILVLDIEGFGDQRRTLRHQLAARVGMYDALRRSFATTGIAWADCHREDRGDGALVLIPAQIPKSLIVDVLPATLATAVHEHNTGRPAAERIRLRLAVHAGEVVFDEHGVAATPVNLAFRLLDAPALKTALADSPGVVALIVSGWLFDEVVRHSPRADPATWRSVVVKVKETRTVGWLSLPDQPYPSDSSVLTAAPADPSLPVPRQLPAATRGFTGRSGELTALSEALDDLGGPVVISVIRGPGGIGKTWLATHWAHQHLDRFPDGQLFVDLRGFSPVDKPLSPATAIRGFLGALGMASQAVPVDEDAQAALYRSLVAQRRMLIVLDNARNTAQAAPLLPGSSSCAVIVTSRNRLDGLVTHHGARAVAVDALDDADARTFLVSRLGAPRVTAEPGAAAELLRYCGGFPLALSIVAGHAQTHPDFPLAALADDLRDAGTRLDSLDDQEPESSLPAVLSWSASALTGPQAEACWLLGTAPGPDIGIPAAAAVLNRTVSETGVLLRSLEQESLVQQHFPGRYRMHDLVRLFAAEQARRYLPEADRIASLRRLADFSVGTACIANRLLWPNRLPIEVSAEFTGPRRPRLIDRTSALAWFSAEHAGLLAIQRVAASHDWSTHVWQLAWALDTFLLRQGYLHEAVEVWRVGLAAADRLGDLGTRILATRLLGEACAWAGRPAEAVDHHRQALRLAQAADDPTAQAYVHGALARAWDRQGAHGQALEPASRALHLFRAAGLAEGEAEMLNAVGWANAKLGRFAQAQTDCAAALAACRRHGDRETEALTVHSLGYIAQHTGRLEHALRHYDEARDVWRDLGDAYGDAEVTENIADVRYALEQLDRARTAWQYALGLYQAQHRTGYADRVRRKLAELPDA